MIRLAWKNLIHRPLAMLLSLILFALGVGLVSLLFQLERQLQDNFEANLAGVDLVIGAKGSPLQMILSSMYHIDAPTGNIAIDDIRPFLNPRHPLIESSLPLSLGDSYRGFRIVGTSTDIFDWYPLEVDRGIKWERNFEVTAGASVAMELGLNIGDRFKSSHGFMDDEDLAHDDADDFVVVGIMKSSGTIVDQLLLTTPQSFWLVHDHDHEEDESSSDESAADVAAADEHDGHDHEEGDHSHSDAHHDKEGAHSAGTIPLPLIQEDGEKEITNLLLQFKGHSFQALNMQRSINQNTDMQAATPAIEINRLFSMMDSGEKALRILAFVIIFVSGLSIFISLFSSLKNRKYELSLMRVMGAQKQKLFLLLIIEGLILAILGCLLGLALAHIGMEVIGNMLSQDYRYNFSGRTFLRKELWLVVGAIAIGLVASILPAWQASRTDISETLLRK
ncbi:MAG: putative ABC transport system permease protein [Saprospiraceae bacterium]|jgi:putative ABC transport system permease protein